MICQKCDLKAICTKPSLCKDHFDTFILETTQETIDKYNLFTKEDIDVAHYKSIQDLIVIP